MLGHDNSRPPSFWSTTHWPTRELAVVLIVAAGVGAAVGFLRREPMYGRLVYGSVATAGMVALGGGLWVFACVLRAWAAQPSPTRVGRWLKTAVRFLLVGPDPQRE